MAEDLQLKIGADISELEAQYGKIKKMEEERATQAQILTQQTLAIRKKALAEEEAALRKIIQAQEEAGASNKEQFQKPIEESTKKIQDLKGQVDALTPATQNVTKAQEQLGKSIKRVESTLRGFAVTAAIAFGAAILKGVIDFAKGLFDAGDAVKRLDGYYKEFNNRLGESLGKTKAQFALLKQLTPGTDEWRKAITALNKEFGDLINLNVDATLADIEIAQARVTREIFKTVRIQAATNVLTEAYQKTLSETGNAQVEAQQEYNKLQEELLPLVQDNSAAEQEAARKNVVLFKQKLEAAKADMSLSEQARAARVQIAEDDLAMAERVEREVGATNEATFNETEKLREKLKANFEQAAKAIQALEDELAKQEIEQVADAVERAIRLADLELAIAIRTAQDTITNKEQLGETIELLGKRFNDRRAEIEKEAQEKLAEQEREQTIEARKTLHDSLNKIEAEEREKTIEATRTRIEAEKLLEERAQQARVDRFNASISAVNSLGDAFRSLSEIVGEETEKGAALAKVAALFDIAASQAVAIAKVIEIAGKTGAAAGPAGPFVFAATLAGLLAVTVANIANAKQLIDGTPLPHHAKGVGETEKGLAVVGERGPEIVMMPKGAAVFNNKAVRTERELIDAINDGTINDLIMRQYVYPAIMAHQSAQKARDKHELKETVSAYFDNAFDDTNLVKIGERQRDLLKDIKHLLKPKATPAPRSRF